MTEMRFFQYYTKKNYNLSTVCSFELDHLKWPDSNKFLGFVPPYESWGKKSNRGLQQKEIKHDEIAKKVGMWNTIQKELGKE